MKNKIDFLLQLAILVLLGGLSSLTAQPRVLAVLPSHFGANTHFNLDNLEENGYQVTLAGVTRQVTSCTFSSAIGSQTFTVDTLLSEVNAAESWDVIAIMPMEWRSTSNPYGDLISCQTFMQLLKEAHKKNVVIWATCAGVRVLAKADIIKNVKVTGRSEYSAEYTAAGAIYLGPNIPPVLDQNIITSTRGMYYMYENIEMISTALERSQLSFNDQVSSSLLDTIGYDMEIDVWNHEYLDKGASGLRAVSITRDGGTIATGYTWSNTGQNADLLIIRTDPTGNLLWHKSLGNSGWEFGWSVIQTQDGGFAATGYSTSNENTDKNLFVVKTDSAGSVIWEKQIVTIGQDMGRDLVETPDGDLVIAGYIISSETQEANILLTRLRSNGELVWSRIYGAAGPEIARSVILNQEGNIILAGESGSTTTGNRDMLLMCLDPDGETKWLQTYHKDNYDSGYEVVQNPDGRYIMIGHGDIHSQDFLELAVVQADSAGNCLSHTFYEATTRFYDYGKSVAISKNGTMALCGIAKKKTTRDNKLFVILIDPDGRFLMNNWIDVPGSAWCTSMIADKDNNFIIAGQRSSDRVSYRSWLFKIQNPLVASIQSHPGQSKSQLRCYPNPFQNNLFIEQPGYETQRIVIVDCLGREIRCWNLDRNSNSGICWDGTLPDGRKAASGWYTVLIDSDLTKEYQKVLYLH